MNILFFLPIIVVLAFIIIWYFLDKKGQKSHIVQLSKLDSLNIINQKKETKTYNANSDLYIQLLQAGITKKEYNEGKLVFALIGIIIAVSFSILFSRNIGIIGIVIGTSLIIFGGKIYLYISKSEREDKINNDLGVFLDLVNILLEAGGGLKNAFFTISTRANGILNEELLKEIAILEYEMTNYSTKKAYESLKKRVGSDDVAKIVDFLILSEEAGIGVKNIFSTQSDEMRQEKFYKIKGKVNTLSLYLMLIIFIFVLPAIGAFIIFPMMSGKLEFGI
ncbi:MAG: type II secretion system F family protein [Arcobacter sp.]|nr:type II secretion system F family protein [Arcobacter sp.]